MRRMVLACLVIVAVLGARAAAPAAANEPAGLARVQLMPALVYNPSVDEYLAVWSEDRGAGPDLYIKRLFSNGLPEGGPERGGSILIRDADPRSTHGPRTAPAIVFNSTPDIQEYLVAWSEERNEVDGLDVWIQRVASPRTHSSEAFCVNHDAAWA